MYTLTEPLRSLVCEIRYQGVYVEFKLTRTMDHRWQETVRFCERHDGFGCITDSKLIVIILKNYEINRQGVRDIV